MLTSQAVREVCHGAYFRSIEQPNGTNTHEGNNTNKTTILNLIFLNFLF